MRVTITEDISMKSMDSTKSLFGIFTFVKCLMASCFVVVTEFIFLPLIRNDANRSSRGSTIDDLHFARRYSFKLPPIESLK